MDFENFHSLMINNKSLYENLKLILNITRACLKSHGINFNIDKIYFCTKIILQIQVNVESENHIINLKKYVK